MACNAHNHSPLCDCGWGGTNYNNSRSEPKVDWSKAKSHTIPNAHCPICSASVFFYRSPDGGTVFFDSLGPPWPKHSCTSNDAYHQTREILTERNKKTKGKARKNKKVSTWWAFPCFKIESLPANEGTCIYGSNNQNLYIKTKAKNIPPHTPIWIRPFPESPGKYYISTFKLINGTLKEQCHIGFSMKGLEIPATAVLFRQTLEKISSQKT